MENSEKEEYAKNLENLFTVNANIVHPIYFTLSMEIDQINLKNGTYSIILSAGKYDKEPIGAFLIKNIENESNWLGLSNTKYLMFEVTIEADTVPYTIHTVGMDGTRRSGMCIIEKQKI